MSNKVNQPQLPTDRSLILTTPANLINADLQSWQNFCTAAIDQLFDKNQTQELIWINSELTSILMEDIRAQIASLQFGVANQNYRLAFILAADQASIQVQNALLKILEEPPARTTIILATPNPASLISTILSRCQTIPLKNQPNLDISNPDLIADLTTLTNLCLQPDKISYGKLSLLASKYKAKTDARNFISSWLNQLTPNLATANSNQLKLADLSLKFQTWLDQNLSPTLALEKILFAIKSPVQN